MVKILPKKILTQKSGKVEDTWTNVDILGNNITADHDGKKLTMIKDKLNEILDFIKI